MFISAPNIARSIVWFHFLAMASSEAFVSSPCVWEADCPLLSFIFHVCHQHQQLHGWHYLGNIWISHSLTSYFVTRTSKRLSVRCGIKLPETAGIRNLQFAYGWSVVIANDDWNLHTAFCSLLGQTACRQWYLAPKCLWNLIHIRPIGTASFTILFADAACFRGMMNDFSVENPPP